MSTDLYFTTDSFFFRRLISELTERNLTMSGHMVGSKCNLKTHVQYQGYSLPLQIKGPKTTFLGRLRNSTTNFTTCVLGMKYGIHKCPTRGLLHRLDTTWTLVHKRLQIGSEFSATLRKFCILLHCQASQTAIRKWNSAKLCQTVDGRPANNMP